MTIWLFALLLTAIACATLYYAGAGRRVNAATGPVDATQAHFRAQLRAIETDAAMGRLGAAEAVAAKGELAREVLRHKADDAPKGSTKLAVWVPVLLVAALVFLGLEAPLAWLTERRHTGHVAAHRETFGAAIPEA